MSRHNFERGSHIADQTVCPEKARAKDGRRRRVRSPMQHSWRGIVNVRKICKAHLQGRYDLKVIDISQRPTLVEGEQNIAAPTVIKKLPLPLRRLLGDMSQTERILLGRDLQSARGNSALSR